MPVSVEPVVLVGASGALGSVVAARLVELGAPPVVATRSEMALPRDAQVIRYRSAESLLHSLRSTGKRYGAIVNCAGMRRLRIRSTAYHRELFEANVSVAHSVRVFGRETKTRVIQVSTGDLDRQPLTTSQEAQLMEVLSVASQSDFDSLVGGDLLRGAASSIDAYTASKRILELMSALDDRTWVLRVSNVIGPTTSSGDTLLPRMVRTLLGGDRLTVEEEVRNWSCEHQFAEFVTSLALGIRKIPSGVLHMYGDYDYRVSAVADLVRQALPLAYGSITVVRAGAADGALRRVDAARMNDLDCDEKPIRPFAELVAEVVSEVRSAQAYETSEYVLEPTEFALRPAVTRGGSIARKTRVDSVTFEKATAHRGYEGAGQPKLVAEAGFYEWIEDTCSSDVQALYPRMLAKGTGQSGTALRFAALDGVNVIQSVARGDTFPRMAVRSAIETLYEGTYLRELRKVPEESGRHTLLTLYVSRALDRIRNLRLLINQPPRPKRLIDLLDRLHAGEVLQCGGLEYRNPLAFLDMIRRSGAAKHPELLPRTTGLCGHGDLTALNMMFGHEEMVRLIDPRGHIGNLDPVYDLGKLFFSLTGFGSIITSRCEITGLSNGYSMSFPAYQRELDESAAWMLQTIADSRVLKPLRACEPYLSLRIKFAAAIHYLADAPYRFAQGRDEDAAMGVILLGSQQIEDVSQLLQGPVYE